MRALVLLVPASLAALALPAFAEETASTPEVAPAPAPDASPAPAPEAAPAEAAEGESSDPSKPPAWETAKPTRRGGFAMGLGVGIGFGASNGFPNDAKKIGYSEYYTESGIGLATGGTLWIGGALGDWVNFGFAGGYSNIFADGSTSPAPLGGFHADVYPLFLLGKAFRDLGATFDFGLSFPKTVDENDKTLIDGGMCSYLFAGAFYEGIQAWQLKMGPYLGAHYIFSDSERRPAMLAGFRITVYSQP
ncbi:MAG: hypothetical protein U0414_32455 [Polyangiaceae bacterium]